MFGFEGANLMLAQWLSWLERRPVTAEAVGSSPIWVVACCRRNAAVCILTVSMERWDDGMRIFRFGKQKRKRQDAGQRGAGREPDEETFRYDRQRHRPVIRASICTGEQVAGFKDLQTGRFTEIMMIRNTEDMDEFMRTYGVAREEIRREW